MRHLSTSARASLHFLQSALQKAQKRAIYIMHNQAK